MLSEASSRLWEPIRSYPAFCSVSRLISHPGIVGGLILFYSTKNKQGTVCRTRATPYFLGLLIGACGQQHASKSLWDV